MKKVSSTLLTVINSIISFLDDLLFRLLYYFLNFKDLDSDDYSYILMLLLYWLLIYLFIGAEFVIAIFLWSMFKLFLLLRAVFLIFRSKSNEDDSQLSNREGGLTAFKLLSFADKKAIVNTVKTDYKVSKFNGLNSVVIGLKESKSFKLRAKKLKQQRLDNLKNKYSK